MNEKLLVKTFKSKISKYKRLRDNFNINTTGNPTSPWNIQHLYKVNDFLKVVFAYLIELISLEFKDKW